MNRKIHRYSVRCLPPPSAASQLVPSAGVCPEVEGMCLQEGFHLSVLVRNVPCTNLENTTEVISGARSKASRVQKLPKMGLSDTAHRRFGHGASEKGKAGHLHVAQGPCGFPAVGCWTTCLLLCSSSPAAMGTSRPCPTEGQTQSSKENPKCFLASIA